MRVGTVGVVSQGFLLRRVCPYQLFDQRHQSQEVLLDRQMECITLFEIDRHYPNVQQSHDSSPVYIKLTPHQPSNLLNREQLPTRRLAEAS